MASTPRPHCPLLWERPVCTCHYFFQFYLCGCPDSVENRRHKPSISRCPHFYAPAWKLRQLLQSGFQHRIQWLKESLYHRVLPFPCYRHLMESRVFISPFDIRKLRNGLMNAQWNPPSARRKNRAELLLHNFHIDKLTWETRKRARNEEDVAQGWCKRRKVEKVVEDASVANLADMMARWTPSTAHSSEVADTESRSGSPTRNRSPPTSLPPRTPPQQNVANNYFTPKTRSCRIPISRDSLDWYLEEQSVDLNALDGYNRPPFPICGEYPDPESWQPHATNPFSFLHSVPRSPPDTQPLCNYRYGLDLPVNGEAKDGDKGEESDGTKDPVVYDGYNHTGYRAGAYRMDLEALGRAREENWERWLRKSWFPGDTPWWVLQPAETGGVKWGEYAKFLSME